MSRVSSIALLAQVFIMLFTTSGTMAQDAILSENLDVPAGYTLYKCTDVVGHQIYDLVNDEWSSLV